MPDELGSWIELEKGVQKLQARELAKAKGMDGYFDTVGHRQSLEAIQCGTCYHLWSSALNAIEQWWHNRSPLPPPTGTSITVYDLTRVNPLISR